MLTPLQEVASRIYAAKYNTVANHDLYLRFNTKIALEDSIEEAKALLEACKPEPLEWKQDKTDSPIWRSKCGQFKIKANFANDYNLWNAMTNTELYPSFETIEEAKQFAEHIRTR